MTEPQHFSTGTFGNINSLSAVSVLCQLGKRSLKDSVFNSCLWPYLKKNFLNWVRDSMLMKLAYNVDSGSTANILGDKIKIYI